MMENMYNLNIERSVLSVKDNILSSFLWSADVGMDTKDAFLLDVSLFKDDESKALALMINKETSGDRYYSLLNMKIEQTMPSLWLKISAQTPMPFSVLKRMHDGLRMNHKNIIMGRI